MHVPRGLRHPAELPFFVVMVVLNVAIVAAVVRAAVVVPFLPASRRRGPLTSDG